MTLLFVGLTLFLAYGAWYTYRTGGWSFTSIGLAFVAVVLGTGSIVETLVTRVEITDDALIVTDLRGRRRIAKSDIMEVGHEQKGAPAAVRLRDGHWVRVPMLVSRYLGNSVHAWLRD